MPASYKSSIASIALAVTLLAGVSAPLAPLFDPDEGYYPATAAETLRSGTFWDLSFNGEPRWDKPILSYGLIEASFVAFGESATAARIPSALEGGVLILIVGSLGPRVPPCDLETRARGLLSDVGLAGKEEVPAERLSYGDQRRLEIARALATEPELLLLDEPFAGLGSGEIEDLSVLIRRLHQEKGLTILLIEHKLREFMKLVSRVIAIDFGEVIATGSPAEIVADPRVIEAYIGRQEVAHAT